MARQECDSLNCHEPAVCFVEFTFKSEFLCAEHAPEGWAVTS